MKLTINPHGMTSADEPALRTAPLATLGRKVYWATVIYFLIAAIPAVIIFLAMLL